MPVGTEGVSKAVTEVTGLNRFIWQLAAGNRQLPHVLCLNLSSKKYSITPSTAFAKAASSPCDQLQV